MLPAITVAVCTYNRYDHLEKCLTALSNQTLSRDRFEVLVVDNGTDKEGRNEFEARSLPMDNCRTIHVPVPGLSRARNIALNEARAPIIAFIDDDALPCKKWLEEILEVFAIPNAPQIVFGPIDPIWPDNIRPEWVRPQFEAAFTILDLGSDSRPASEHESGYGANIAFLVDALRIVGGFSENAGRLGKNLQSGEEVAAQLAIRKAGGRAYYAARARVAHHVHRDRMRRSWLFARFAWQGVADRVEGVEWADVKGAIYRLSRNRQHKALGEFLQALFNNDSQGYSELSSKLDAIRDLTSLLLSLNELDDAELVGVANRMVTGAPSPTPVVVNDAAVYRWAPPIPPGTRLVVAEGTGQLGHHYLLGPLRKIDGMQHLAIDLSYLDKPCGDYPGLVAAVSGRQCALLFLTLDNHIYWTNRRVFAEAIAGKSARVSGVLHRLPTSEEDAEALRHTGAMMHSIIMLSPELASLCRERFGLTNVAYVPHIAQNAGIATEERATLREKMGIARDAVVFCMTGEQRPGKGLPLLLEALPHVTPEVRDRLFFVLAGKADRKTIDEARAAFLLANVEHRIDLRSNERRNEYVVLSNSEFAERIAVADFGLLLFQGDQREVMSGAISDYLVRGAGLVATDSSIVGQIVKRLGAGFTLEDETPEGLARLIERIVDNPQKPCRDAGPIAEYLASVDDAAVARCFEEVLGLRRKTERKAGWMS